LLVAALNPCPCGFKGSRIKDCTCTQSQIQKYSRKVSGPIIDRIDIWLDVPQIKHEELSSKAPAGESSEKIRSRVLSARAKQTNRFEDIKNISTNGEMGAKELKKYAPLTDSSTKLLNDSAKRLNLSARAYHRIIKLARTIADLDNSTDIQDQHLLEALQYRPKNIFE
jgi:magnesium chelatase family protein